MGDLTRNFSRAEFACKCGCGFDDISIDLVERLQIIRDLSGKQVVVSSGCRCESHNACQGGSRSSSHLIGVAVDIVCPSAHDRFELTQLLIYKFARIGLHSCFIHVDMDLRPFKSRNIIWLYA